MAEDEKVSAEGVVRDIRRQTRRKYGAEEKFRIELEGLRGEESIAAQHGYNATISAFTSMLTK